MIFSSSPGGHSKIHIEKSIINPILFSDSIYLYISWFYFVCYKYPNPLRPGVFWLFPVLSCVSGSSPCLVLVSCTFRACLSHGGSFSYIYPTNMDNNILNCSRGHMLRLYDKVQLPLLVFFSCSASWMRSSSFTGWWKSSCSTFLHWFDYYSYVGLQFALMALVFFI